MALQWLDEGAPFKILIKIFGGHIKFWLELHSHITSSSNQNLMPKNLPSMCLSLPRAKANNKGGWICLLNLSTKWPQHDVSLVSSTCLERKKQKIDINLKRCIKWKEEKKKHILLIKCSWNVSQIHSDLKPSLPLKAKDFVESQFFCLPCTRHQLSWYYCTAVLVSHQY